MTLRGKVAVVAGATRGAGRGIATALGERGATVYCTGRSSREQPGGRPETIDETAELVTARGGRGIAVRVDHSQPEEVERLFERVRADEGRLDILVNDIWGGDELTQFATPFWKLSIVNTLTMIRRGVETHIITSRFGVPLMLDSGGGLVVEITDGDFYTYRGNLAYDFVKTSVIRLAYVMAYELRRKNIAAVAVTPGFLRSEAMLERMGVTEANWREAKDPHFAESETPLFVGRAVASLASDPEIMKKSGRVLASWNLAEEYGFDDADGRRPHWGRYFEKTFGFPIKSCDEQFYQWWREGAIERLYPDWP
jgi:NAD(P)-dependent dehydrogenase (short-subunit alcohol dehydrogenase family)